ncbi:MAG: hypothetical protein ACE5I1_00290 [bacterium]
MKIYWAVSLCFVLSSFNSCGGPDFVIEYSDEIADARGNETNCDLHQSSFAEDTVGIVYGFVIFDSEYEKAKQASFPNARTYMLGGCVITPGESPEFARVLSCAECRRVEKSWLADKRN